MLNADFVPEVVNGTGTPLGNRSRRSLDELVDAECHIQILTGARRSPELNLARNRSGVRCSVAHAEQEALHKTSQTLHVCNDV